MKESKGRIVWSDEKGDLRKSKTTEAEIPVNEKQLELKLRRLSAGKGRVVIELTGLPQNKSWNQALSSDLKKQMGVGGTYKDKSIEIHTDKFDLLTKILDKRSLKWKKVGG